MLNVDITILFPTKLTQSVGVFLFSLLLNAATIPAIAMARPPLQLL